MSSTYSLAIEGASHSVTGRSDQSVLDACLAAGIAFPYNCRSGECGECLAHLHHGHVLELPGADPAVFDDTHSAQGLILACLSYPRSDLALSVKLRSESGPPIQEFDAIVTSITRLKPAIVELVATTDAPIDFRAGQYFEWILPGIAPDRSFSAANRPGSTRLEFHVRLYDKGLVSQYLARKQILEGDLLTLRGPYGSFRLTDDDYRPAILVAGGTGLAPIKAILDEAFTRGCRRPLRFFYGARRESDLYHIDTMRQWARSYPNFEFVPALSDEPADSGWPGERGLVTDVLARHLPDAFGAEAFLCGPPPMIDAAVAVLARLGVDASDIHFDKFTPAS